MIIRIIIITYTQNQQTITKRRRQQRQQKPKRIKMNAVEVGVIDRQTDRHIYRTNKY